METDAPRQAVVVLLSGGIDSSALIRYYLHKGFEVSAVHFQYGQLTARSELKAAKAIAQNYSVPLQVIPLGFQPLNRHGEILCRNTLFALAAVASLPKTRTVAIGIHSGTPYYDCTPRFVDDLQCILDGYFAGTVVLAAPFLHLSKGAVYQYSRQNAIPVELTYSCEVQEESPCGRCPSCLDRERYYER